MRAKKSEGGCQLTTAVVLTAGQCWLLRCIISAQARGKHEGGGEVGGASDGAGAGAGGATWALLVAHHGKWGVLNQCEIHPHI